MRTMRVAWMVMVLLFFVVPAWAAGLTPIQVEGFISAMTELKPMFDSYADEIGDDGDASSTVQIMKDWTVGMQTHQEFLSVLNKNGFDVASWEAVVPEVIQAYMAIQFGKDGTDAVAQMQQSLQEIEQNPDIPEGQKAEIRTQMQASIAEFEKILATSPENQDVVRPFVPRLNTIFEWQD
ncbi:hypothetical protein MASR1M90_03330 [Desulfovibrionales bacterium]